MDGLADMVPHMASLLYFCWLTHIGSVFYQESQGWLRVIFGMWNLQVWPDPYGSAQGYQAPGGPAGQEQVLDDRPV